MPPDLSSAHWKIDRAKELLDGLDAEVRAWIDTKPGAFHIYKDPTFTRVSVTFKRYKQPSLTRWSLIFADIIHNLRCSLDHAFWAVLENEFPSGLPKGAEKLSFPIWDTPPNSDSRKSFKPAGDKLFRAIDSVQPYNNVTAEFPVHPLAIIRDIDNGNKHKLLFSLICCLGIIKVTANYRHRHNKITTSEFYKGPLAEDVELVSTEFEIPEPYMEYKCENALLLIAVIHPIANRLGADRDDYAALVDSLIIWVQKTIDNLVANVV